MSRALKAAGEIAAAIARLDKAGVDEIIVARGGGSREDLWVFNAEAIARAAYRCKTPLISAIGHEIDYTILDFVADQRAPTPSAAAELAVPDRQVLRARLYELEENMHRNMQKRRDLCYNTCKAYADALAGDLPRQKLRRGREQLSALCGALQAGSRASWSEKDRRFRHARRSSGSLAQPLSGAGAGLCHGGRGRRQDPSGGPAGPGRYHPAGGGAPPRAVPGDGSGGDR